MRQTKEQRTATERLRTLPGVAENRFRVAVDVEGWPVIPGRYGQIEWYCDGIECHSCPMSGRFGLAVYTDRRRMIPKLAAIPAVRKYQTGDDEARLVFEPELLARPLFDKSPDMTFKVVGQTRLSEKIVNATLQCSPFDCTLGMTSEKDHGNPPGARIELEQVRCGVSTDPGQDEIHDDHVGRYYPGEHQSVFAIRGGTGIVSGGVEVRRVYLSGVNRVVNDKHPAAPRHVWGGLTVPASYHMGLSKRLVVAGGNRAWWRLLHQLSPRITT